MEPSIDHAEKYQQRQPIHLITTRDANGIDCYFVLRASKANYMKLTMQLNKAPIDVSDYGKVLASGFGQKPHQRQADELHEKYGVTFDA